MFVGVVALLLCVLCVRTGVAAYFREDAPQLAIVAAPEDARAAMFLGERLLFNQDKPDLHSAAVFARRALLRDTTLATPYRVIGFEKDQQGDDKAAERFIGDAARLSPRDLAAQLWLINRAVARDDVPAAVGRFDVALRSSSLASPLLMPILSQALAEPLIVDALAPRLIHAPWAAEFMTQAIATSTAMPGLVRLAGRMQRLGAPLPDDNMRQLVNRLVEAKEFGLVRLLRPITAARQTQAEFVNDPNFDRPGAVPNFEWTLGTNDAVDVTRNAETGNGRGVAFAGHQGAVGEVGRQLLTLAPGNYRLSVVGSSNAVSQAQAPRWSITCANGGATFGALDMAGNGPKWRGTADVAIPLSCPGQWLVLALRPSSVAARGQVDEVRVTPL